MSWDSSDGLMPPPHLLNVRTVLLHRSDSSSAWGGVQAPNYCSVLSAFPLSVIAKNASSSPGAIAYLPCLTTVPQRKSITRCLWFFCIMRSSMLAQNISIIAFCK